MVEVPIVDLGATAAAGDPAFRNRDTLLGNPFREGAIRHGTRTPELQQPLESEKRKPRASRIVITPATIQRMSEMLVAEATGSGKFEKLQEQDILLLQQFTGIWNNLYHPDHGAVYPRFDPMQRLAFEYALGAILDGRSQPQTPEKQTLDETLTAKERMKLPPSPQVLETSKERTRKVLPHVRQVLRSNNMRLTHFNPTEEGRQQFLEVQFRNAAAANHMRELLGMPPVPTQRENITSGIRSSIKAAARFFGSTPRMRAPQRPVLTAQQVAQPQ